VGANSIDVALTRGASSGIGAVYADRLARRSHDPILVARNRERLDALAARLNNETGHSVRVIVAGLNNKSGFFRLEEALRTDLALHCSSTTRASL
jgi:short-subunit dehydrogenase